MYIMTAAKLYFTLKQNPYLRYRMNRNKTSTRNINYLLLLIVRLKNAGSTFVIIWVSLNQDVLFNLDSHSENYTQTFYINIVLYHNITLCGRTLLNSQGTVQPHVKCYEYSHFWKTLVAVLDESA